jgi:hypothetical protein
MDETFAELVDGGVDTRRACKLVGRPRSTHHWRRKPRAVPVQRVPRPRPANALAEPGKSSLNRELVDRGFKVRDKPPTLLAGTWVRGAVAVAVLVTRQKSSRRWVGGRVRTGVVDEEFGAGLALVTRFA